MTIGIDIDDTITDSYEVVRDFILTYSDDDEIKQNIEGIIRGTYVSEGTKTFYKKNSKIIGNMINVKENAKEYIDKLHNDGYKIIIITARNNDYYDDAYAFCEEYLNSYGIYYDKLIVDQPYKIKACKDNNIDIMVDDAIDTIEDCDKNGIKGILFNSQINLKKETNSKRVSSWEELYNYIIELKKI